MHRALHLYTIYYTRQTRPINPAIDDDVSTGAPGEILGQRECNPPLLQEVEDKAKVCRPGKILKLLVYGFVGLCQLIEAAMKRASAPLPPPPEPKGGWGGYSLACV